MYHKGYYAADGKRVKGSGLTPSSIRRSACQWAGRCKAGLIDLANNGRWVTLDMVIHYHALGGKKREESIRLHGKDRILNMWVWKPVTAAEINAL